MTQRFSVGEAGDIANKVFTQPHKVFRTGGVISQVEVVTDTATAYKLELVKADGSVILLADENDEALVAGKALLPLRIAYKGPDQLRASTTGATTTAMVAITMEPEEQG